MFAAISEHGALFEWISKWGYEGVFLALLGAGFGVPIPEEVPVLCAGVLVGHENTQLRWYVMLPVVIAGVVISDFVLYGAGRLWGRKLLDIGFVKRRIISPEKQAKLEKNFADHGIMVLLGVRLLPGVRAPAFVMAGIMRVPLTQFVIADAIYAIPLVNVLFWLSYLLTDQVLEMFNKVKEYETLLAVAVLSGIAGVFIYKYVVGKRVSTGETENVPAVISKPVEAIEHAVEKAVEKVEHAVEKAVETVTGHHHEETGTGDHGPGADGKPEGAGDKPPEAALGAPPSAAAPSADGKAS
jgi:membrane protein DedA with SNARE-associated domain